MNEVRIDQNIGKRLRLLRTLRGVSQENLGTALGISAQQIQKYEKGTNSLKANKIFEIARYFDMPVGDLFKILHEQDPAETGEAELLESSTDAVKLLKHYRQIHDPELQAAVLSFVRAVSEKKAVL